METIFLPRIRLNLPLYRFSGFVSIDIFCFYPVLIARSFRRTRPSEPALSRGTGPRAHIFGLDNFSYTLYSSQTHHASSRNKLC